MLQLVFEREDLQRVRVAGAADPMWELVLGLQMSQYRSVPAPYVPWRRELGRRLGGLRRGSDSVSLLRYLVAPTGDFPDFLTPPEFVADIDAGCAAIASTSRGRLAADVAAVFPARSAPTWVRSLAGGDRDQVGAMVRATRVGHDLFVAPHWNEIQQVVAVDRANRARELAAHGVGTLLRNLPGILGWDGRVLQTLYPEKRTVHLAGRGLILLPSYFCWGNPITWIDPELPPVLVYQARGRNVPSLPDLSVSDRLVSLVGRTRAECLRALTVARTTSELAHQLGTSIGTASKQATVLRDGGLITSRRRGTAVLHTITSLGIALMTGDLPNN